MKKINFLIKLHKDNKLKEVEPIDEIKMAYLQRSDESISSAKALLKINNLKDAVALAYYSMYHSLLALLFRIGIKSENHAASIILLKEAFDIAVNEEIVNHKKVFVAHCLNLGIVSQGYSYENAIKNIEDAIRLYLKEYHIT